MPGAKKSIAKLWTFKV